ncbi:helix-turn-helix domain-containing protein [Streptomyces sp. NPDC048629]|uniref:helix-turn-helix domain-containing protein n=1 Tax=Streptomyces sp. NPDC048629 TaxID=3154824 RepID=UPI003447B9EB
MHRTRINRHGDPHFTEWGTADEYDVDLIVRERRPAEGLTRLERVLVARGLTKRGASEAEIAEIVQVDPRTVRRWRAADREHNTAA